jgi:hypothetical protein
MIERDQKLENEWIAEHTLSKQELRQLILEKMERAKLLHQVEKNRKLSKFA